MQAHSLAAALVLAILIASAGAVRWTALSDLSNGLKHPDVSVFAKFLAESSSSNQENALAGTLLVPSNKAVQDFLDKHQLERLDLLGSEDISQLHEKHFLPDSVLVDAAADGQELITSGGKKLILTLRDGVLGIVDGGNYAQILRQEVQEVQDPAGNVGKLVIWAIDNVLTEISTPQVDASLSTHRRALQQSNFASPSAAINALTNGLKAALLYGFGPDWATVVDSLSPSTFFAPSDKAFADLTAFVGGDLGAVPNTSVAYILTYHVANGSAIPLANLTNFQSIGTAAGGLPLAYHLPGSGGGENSTIQDSTGLGANIIIADIQAGTSIIHVVDKVLLPNPIAQALVGPSLTNISSALSALGLNTASTLIDVANLTSALAGITTPFTMFVPTDAAFDQVAEQLGIPVVPPPAAIAFLLLYHVSPSRLNATSLTVGQSIPTLQGNQTFTVSSTNGFFGFTDTTTTPSIVTGVNYAVGSDVLIHIIDKVMIPAGLTEVIQNSSYGNISSTLELLGLDALGALAAYAGIAANFSDGNGPYTIFAPTNEAFASALANLDIDSLEDFIDATPPSVVAQILTYHVTAPRVLTGDLTDGQVVQTGLAGQTLTVVKAANGSVALTDGLNATVPVAVPNITYGQPLSAIHIIDQVLLPANIAEILGGNNTSNATGYDTIVEALTGEGFTFLALAVGTVPALAAAAANESTAVTIFAPKDATFTTSLLALNITDPTQLLSNAPLVTEVLSYHIATTVIPDLTAAITGTSLTLPTLLSGQDIIATKNGTGATLRGFFPTYILNASRAVKAGASYIYPIEPFVLISNETAQALNLTSTPPPAPRPPPVASRPPPSPAPPPPSNAAVTGVISAVSLLAPLALAIMALA